MSEQNQNPNDNTATSRKTRTQWNVPNDQFVMEYQKADSAKAVAAVFKIPVSVVNSRASSLRRKGISLKHFSGTRTRVNVQELNRLISENS